MCEPTKKLRKCRYFRDITWSYITFPQNVTQQIVHCACPKNSVAYIVKRKMFYSAGELGYHYAFACSPQSRLRCQRKEPCRLFTVRKKERHQEVNTSTLCQCPHNHRCPKHHLDPGVIPGKAYIEDNIRTFSGYCINIAIGCMCRKKIVLGHSMCKRTSYISFLQWVQLYFYLFRGIQPPLNSL
ncbi:Protein giant-lens [Armadillidium nasatum]|uniref:Protein giant-lens n=1 Tax=Armadillidium nasatum TaxID=96803 RepID=A0A5N5T6R1_9CRUS|nr:Protein giant-lens [Armadillidium nasatum]